MWCQAAYWPPPPVSAPTLLVIGRQAAMALLSSTDPIPSAEPVMQPSRDISRLIEIMAALRNPVGGCPWDLVQDFSTIRHYTIEEAYEVADAIERQDFADLREELGDLLLQPIYHAQMASEAGHFDIGDVIYSITEKLIRRHPHVFGDLDANDAEAAQSRWEAIKVEERAAKAARKGDVVPSVLDDVASTLPALARAEKLTKRAARVGFDWPDLAAVSAKVSEELEEVTEAAQSGDAAATHEEIGDLLFAVANLLMRRRRVATRRGLGDFGQFLTHLGTDRRQIRPVETDARRTLCQLFGPSQGGQGARYVIEH